MKRLILIPVFASFVIACDSPAAKNTVSNSSANKAAPAATNTNKNNSSSNENAYTTASNSSLGNLKPSVGKTVGEIKLWQNKVVDGRLKKLMGAEYATMKKFLNVETPIEKFGDFLMMTGCEQHNCGDNQYVIFMDTAEDNINVALFKNGASKEWNEHGAIALPPPFAEELAAMKPKK